MSDDVGEGAPKRMSRRTMLRGLAGIVTTGAVIKGVDVAAKALGSKTLSLDTPTATPKTELYVSQNPVLGSEAPTVTPEEDSSIKVMAVPDTSKTLQSPTSQTVDKVTSQQLIEVPKEVPLPAEMTKEMRNTFGALKIPETAEGVNVSFSVFVYDREGNPVADPRNPNQQWRVDSNFPKVRQYRNESEGGNGNNEYSWEVTPDANTTMVTGDPKDPAGRELIIRAHSGKNGDQNLDAELLRQLHDTKYVKDENGEYKLMDRTEEEQKIFRDSHVFKIEMKWKDKDENGNEIGEEKRQDCIASMHQLPMKNTSEFLEGYMRGDKPRPRITDQLPDEERADGKGNVIDRKVPRKFDPWQNWAIIYFCGDYDPEGGSEKVKNQADFFAAKVMDEEDRKFFKENSLLKVTT